MDKQAKTIIGPVFNAMLLVIAGGYAISAGIAQARSTGSDSTGVEILPARAYPFKVPLKVNEAAAHRMHELYELGMRNPEHFGYPWINEDTGEVVVTVASSTGEELAHALVPGVRSSSAKQRLQAVERSWQDLENIRDDIIRRSRSRDDRSMGSIVKIEPDGEHNRLIVTVTSLDKAMLASGLERYGAGSVAVRHDPGHKFSELQIGSRTSDRSPFTAGATAGCTMGMPWHWWQNGVTFTQGMLTAGHCQPNGGGVHTVEYVGYIYPSTRENWDDNVGTVRFPGQTWYAGDIAAIELPFYNSHQARMYRSAVSTRPIRQIWSRSSSPGDLYCTGGAVTHELCGWQVNAVHIDVVSGTLPNGTKIWKRNVIEGGKYGPCTRPGDSGGATYTVRSDGAIASKGIHSGLWVTQSGYCVGYFTDIWTIYYTFGGGHPTS